VALLLANLSAAAPPKLESFFPAGVQRGQEATLTATGSFGHWPASVWVDRPGLEVTPQSEKGKLQVKVGAEAALGVYWLRVYDAEGGSTLRPLFVDVLPELTETEPNNRIDEATKLTPSSIVNGRLQSRGDSDTFAMELHTGQTLVASLEANRTLGSPMDAVLQVCSAEGFVLEQNDDARDLDPLIVFQPPRDGVYLVRCFAFPSTPDSTIGYSGGDTHLYRLTLTTGGFIDHAMPLAVPAEGMSQVVACGWNIPPDAPPPTLAADTLFDPSSSSFATIARTNHHVYVADEQASVDHPQTIALPADLTGRISQPDQAQVFQFQAAKDQKLTFRVASDALGFLLDPTLQLLAPDGKVLADVDDGRRRQRDCELTQTIPADGEYRLVIRDAYGHGGFRYVYRLTAGESQPDYSLTLATDTFVLTPSQPLEIPVAVDRRNGFSDDIEITPLGLPEGIRVTPAKSESQGDSAKSVKLKLESDAGPYSGPFQISGRSTGAAPLERVAAFETSGTSHQHTHAWLTVSKPTDQ